MPTTIGFIALKTTRIKSKRKSLTESRPLKKQFGHAEQVKYLMASFKNRIPMSDDADRNYLIPVELQPELVAWIEHDFTGNEDRFDNYRLRDC